VAWDRLWGGCLESFAASPGSPKHSIVHHTTTWGLRYACRWFPGVIQVAPQEAVTLPTLIYPANSFWSVGRPHLIGCCGSVPMDLTLLGSIQPHSSTVRPVVPTLGPQGGVRNMPCKLQEVRTSPALSVAHFMPYKAALSSHPIVG